MFGGNFIEIVIGGAPFNPEVEAFLRKINFPYTIAYGMTECAPLICHSRWDEILYTSCGKTVANMETKVISEDPERIPGELVCRGMNVMLGYYKTKVLLHRLSTRTAGCIPATWPSRMQMETSSSRAVARTCCLLLPDRTSIRKKLKLA